MMTKAVFQLEPLTCPTCVKKIETAIGKTKGVSEAKVLFNTSKLKTEFDSSLVQAGELETTLEKLGYPVRNKKVS